jgi:hypothetical protein
VAHPAIWAYFKWIKPRRSPIVYPFRIAADPLPSQRELAAERRGQMLRRGRVLTGDVLEKIILVSLLTIIFSQIAPNVDSSPGGIVVAVVALIVANTAASLWAVRRGRARLQWTIRAFLELLVLNLGLVLVFAFLERDGGDFDGWSLLFFSYLLTLIIVLYDRYRSVYVARFGGETGTPPGFLSVISDAWHNRPAPEAAPLVAPAPPGAPSPRVPPAANG